MAVNSLDGRFAVTWIVETAGQFSPTIPKTSIYTVSSGSPVVVVTGLSLPGVSAAGDRALFPPVAGDESGNFMFVWNRTRGDNGNNELRRRIINADLTLTNASAVRFKFTANGGWGEVRRRDGTIIKQ